MGEILAMMVKSGLEKNIFEIPPCAHHVIFITEFVLLIKTPSFYDMNSFNKKMACAWRNFKNIFSRPLFHQHS